MAGPEQQRHRSTVDDQQQRLDRLDGARDGKFGKADELRATYAERVNDAQARIRQVRTRAETMKDAKKPGWEKLDAACDDQEAKLVETLRAIVRPEDMAKAETGVEARVADALKTLADLHPEKENGTADVRKKLETSADAMHAANREVERLRAEIQTANDVLGKDAKDNSGQAWQTESSKDIGRQRIERIGRLQTQLEAAQKTQVAATTEFMGGDIAVLKAEAQAAFDRGETVTGNRTLIKIWERYGNAVDLAQVDPALAAKIDAAKEELRAQNQLTPFEKTYFDKNASHDEKLRVAVEEQRKMDHMVDAVDQLKQGKTFSTSGYKLPTWGTDNPPTPSQGRLRTVNLPTGASVEGVLVSLSAEHKLHKCPPGMKVILLRTPEAIQLRKPQAKNSVGGFLGLDMTAWHIEKMDTITAGDLAYASVNGDTVTYQQWTDSDMHRQRSIPDLERDRDERVGDVLRCVDSDPAVTIALGTAANVNRECRTVQSLFQGGSGGGKYEQFVEFSRNGANDLLKLLDDPDTVRNAETAKQKLVELKKTQIGVAHSPLEAELDARIKALDGLVEALKDPKLRAAIDTIRDKSQWSADTWANWAKNEGPRIVAAVAVAVAATALVMSTCGGGLVVIAAAGAAGGMAGSEIAREVQHSMAQYDEDVAEGRATYTDRSKAGAYLAGDKTRDAETGELRDRELMADVVNPYAQEFASSFATTLATMGASNAAGGAISRFLNNGRVLQALGKHAPTVNKILTRLQRLELAQGDKAAKTMREFAGKFGTEFVDELKDEAAETATDKFLTQVQAGLGQAEGELGLGDAAAFLVGTVQNIRLRKPGVMTYSAKPGVDNARVAADLKTNLEKNDYVVTVDGADPSVLLVSNKSGSEAYRVEPDAAAPDSKGEADAGGRNELSADDARMKETIMALPDTEDGYAKRVEAAEYLLGITLDDSQKKAVKDAHDVPMAGDEYSLAELRQKMTILEAAGFERAQADRLLRMGVCGVPSKKTPESPDATWKAKYYLATDPKTGERTVYEMVSNSNPVRLRNMKNGSMLLVDKYGSDHAARGIENNENVAVKVGDMVRVPQYEKSGEDRVRVTSLGPPITGDIVRKDGTIGRPVGLTRGTFILETSSPAPAPAQRVAPDTAPAGTVSVDSLPIVTGAPIVLIGATSKLRGQLQAPIVVGSPIVFTNPDGSRGNTSPVAKILVGPDKSRTIVTASGSTYALEIDRAAMEARGIRPASKPAQAPAAPTPTAEQAAKTPPQVESVPNLAIAPGAAFRLQKFGEDKSFGGKLDGPIAVGQPIARIDDNGARSSTAALVKEILVSKDENKRVIVFDNGSRYELLPGAQPAAPAQQQSPRRGPAPPPPPPLRPRPPEAAPAAAPERPVDVGSLVNINGRQGTYAVSKRIERNGYVAFEVKTMDGRQTLSGLMAADVRPAERPAALPATAAGRAELLRGLGLDPGRSKAAYRQLLSAKAQYDALANKADLAEQKVVAAWDPESSPLELEKLRSAFDNVGLAYDERTGDFALAPAATPEAPAQRVPNVQANAPRRAPPPPPAAPTRPRQPEAVRSPAGKRLDDAARYAGETNLFASKDLENMLQSAMDEGEIIIHTNVTYPGSEKYMGYTTYGNARAEAKEPRLAADRGTVGKGIVYGNEHMYEQHGGLLLTYNRETPGSSKESVRLGPAKNGRREITYVFTAENYIDQSKRHGSMIGVTIETDAKKAEAIYAELQRNPSAVRPFFIAASADVQRSEEIWRTRKPTYGTSPTRDVLFAERRDARDPRPALELTYMRQENGRWVRAPLPAEAAKKESEAVKRAERTRQNQLNPSPPTTSQPKKGWFGGLFG